MDIWNKFVNTVHQASYIRLNTDDTNTDADKIVDIWSDIDENKINAPLPKMISISGKTYISLDEAELRQNEVIPKILTSKGYLNSTELRKKTEQTHLQFTNRTYFQHFNESMKFCGKTISSGWFFFINGLFPDCFPYIATDKIILLSENILEKYSDVLDNQALLATGVRIPHDKSTSKPVFQLGEQPRAQPQPDIQLPLPIKIPGNKTRIQHLLQ